jgi:hypothetical protein
MGNNVFVASTAEVLAMHEATVKALTAARDAAIRERDEARKSWLRSEESGTRLLAQRNAALDDADALRKRVAELEAASGGGEPVAWGVIDERQKVREQFEERDDAVSYARAAIYGQIVEKQKLTVVPLYRSPPQPRGWLTAEEREALWWFAREEWPRSYGAANRHADTVRSLLARSTPPEVVLTEAFNRFDTYGDRVASFDAHHVRRALAAAGVAVKE